MVRLVLTDAQWEKMEPFCMGRSCDPGKTGSDVRMFVEGVLWIARTGSPWRDLPEEFGAWHPVFKRFRHWLKRGVFDRMFAATAEDADLEYAMIDGTIVKVHRHGQGARGGPKVRPLVDPEAV